MVATSSGTAAVPPPNGMSCPGPIAKTNPAAAHRQDSPPRAADQPACRGTDQTGGEQQLEHEHPCGPCRAHEQRRAAGTAEGEHRLARLG
jgi:hypothetical protein